VFGSKSFTGVYILTPIENVRKRIYAILISERDTDPTGKLFHSFIVGLIILNIVAVILETVETLHLEYKPFFDVLEIFTVVIFTIEYILRVWVCTLEEKYKHRFGRLKFMISPMAVIELLVILPFVLSLLTFLDLRYLSAFRFILVLRIFKLGKYAEALDTFKHVIFDKKEELVITFFTIIALLVVSSSLMYLVERNDNPEFASIPETMWWAVSTLTTVGYGDVLPITPLGKILGSLIAILGIAMFALPAGLISASFTEQVQNKRKKRRCPHCDKEL
jgi:voltage-gated potassium channel